MADDLTEICPTVTATNAHTFRQQMERVAPFARRVHIDLMDGIFAPRKSLSPSEVWWPAGVKADIHLMFQNPAKQLDTIINLRPDLIIIHAEADGNFFEIAQRIKKAKINVGLALLKQTSVIEIELALSVIDHVLVFSGNLGYQGGSQAELNQLTKIKSLRILKSDLEIGWDGGVTEHNIRQLADSSVDVLNVGGYIQRAEDAGSAYAKLMKLITKV